MQSIRRQLMVSKYNGEKYLPPPPPPPMQTARKISQNAEWDQLTSGETFYQVHLALAHPLLIPFLAPIQLILVIMERISNNHIKINNVDVYPYRHMHKWILILANITNFQHNATVNNCRSP